MSFGLLTCMHVYGQAPASFFALTQIQKERAQVSTQTLASIKQQDADTLGNLQAFHLPGTVSIPLDAQQIITAPVSGVIQNILVMPSENVKAGQALIRLYSQQILQWQRDFLQASSQAQFSHGKLERDRALYAEGIIAQNRLQETENTARQNQVSVNENTQLLRLAGMSTTAINALRTKQSLSPIIDITANGAGSVLEYSAAPGQYVEAGVPLGKLIQRDKGLWVELRASRHQAALIQPGDQIKFAHCPDEAKVTVVSQQLDVNNQTILVRGSIANPTSCLHTNQYLDTTVYTRKPAENSWVIPASAIINHENNRFVFVEEKDGFQVQPIEIISRSSGFVKARPLQTSFQPETRIAISGTAALKGSWLGIGAEGEENSTKPNGE